MACASESFAAHCAGSYLPVFSEEGLHTPHQHAKPRVHRGQTRGAFIDHGLHVRLRRRRLEANVAPWRIARLC